MTPFCSCQYLLAPRPKRPCKLAEVAGVTSFPSRLTRSLAPPHSWAIFQVRAAVPDGPGSPIRRKTGLDTATSPRRHFVINNAYRGFLGGGCRGPHIACNVLFYVAHRKRKSFIFFHPPRRRQPRKLAELLADIRPVAHTRL